MFTARLLSRVPSSHLVTSLRHFSTPSTPLKLPITTQRFSTTTQTPLFNHLPHLKPSNKLQFTPYTFRKSRPTLDWHQKVDNKTGKFYYIDIFTGQKTDVQPKVFLPYDAPKESAAMSILRHDRVDNQGVVKKQSVLRPLLTVAVIMAVLYALDHFGYVDAMFGYEPPPKRQQTAEQRVIDEASQNMKLFLDRFR